MKKNICIFYLSIFAGTILYSLEIYAQIPPEFVYLRKVDPSIIQDIRYRTSHNFIGSPIKGYQAGECVLTRQAAQALASVQKELQQSGLSLKVFDCYRPQMAVDEFIEWSRQPDDQKMKKEFYPRVDKKDFFALGYVAAKSGHTRGSTVDLTIVPKGAAPAPSFNPTQDLVNCNAPYLQRFKDQGIDMGGGFDCMDKISHTNFLGINPVAHFNRLILKTLMEKYGFAPYAYEWWHFTLKNEPYPNCYFNFPITSIK